MLFTLALFLSCSDVFGLKDFVMDALSFICQLNEPEFNSFVLPRVLHLIWDYNKSYKIQRKSAENLSFRQATKLWNEVGAIYLTIQKKKRRIWTMKKGKNWIKKFQIPFMEYLFSLIPVNSYISDIKYSKEKQKNNFEILE